MREIIELWSLFRSSLASVLKTISFVDFLDILIVAYLIYQAMRLVRETRAMQLVKGIGAIFVLFFVAQLLDMTMLQFFIQNILSWGVIVIAVVFQPEVRRALDQIGRTRFSAFGKPVSAEELQEKNQAMIEAVCAACSYLSSQKTGALMVIERETRLGEIIKTGTTIDAVPSLEMIANLFFHNSPLHDGAVVIRDGRLLTAGCFLPLSSNMEIGRELGTRHRAALGMSEVSDAVVVVVSEETGAISVAADGKLQRKLSPKNLRMLLEAKLLGAHADDAKPAGRFSFWRKKP